MNFFNEKTTAVMVLFLLIFSFVTMLFVVSQNKKVKSQFAKIRSRRDRDNSDEEDEESDVETEKEQTI